MLRQIEWGGGGGGWETDVSTKNEVFHLLLHIFNIKIDYKDLYLSTQMSMAILFVSA